MHHPERWTFDWFYKRHDMDKADNRFYRQTETERRAAELHEGCKMPMEQARELAASEASPAAGAMLSDWYARGQNWALADAMSGSLPNDWTAGDIARAYAAGARAADQSARIAELVAVLARQREATARKPLPLPLETVRDLVKECGLDWHRGFVPLFDGDETNRYEVLIRAVEHCITGEPT